MRFYIVLTLVLLVLSSAKVTKKKERKRNLNGILKHNVPKRQKSNRKCRKWSRMRTKLFCNNSTDCRNGIDEMVPKNISLNLNYNVVRCNNAETPVNKTCLLKEKQFCSGFFTCVGYSPCDHGCSTHFLCPDGKTCLKRSTVCDRVTCNDCPTLDSWPNGPGFKCVKNSIKCNLPQLLLWDGIQDCDDGADLCYEKPNGSLSGVPTDIRNLSGVQFNWRRCFKCLDDSTIINKQSICDGIFDCPDLSDECLCQGNIPTICANVEMPFNEKSVSKRTKMLCLPGQVICPENKCINRSEVCDGKVDCANAIDENAAFCRGTIPCANATKPYERCRCSHLAAKTCFRRSAVYCDEVQQCILKSRKRVLFNQPAEDECTGKCLAISSGKNSSSSKLSIDCTWRPPTNRTTFVCKGFRGKRLRINISLVCDGVVDCQPKKYRIANDESHCPGRFRCKSIDHKSSIPRTKRCDGIIDCINRADELRKMCKKRYYCKGLNNTKISIPKEEKCDFVINCDNASDEMNCSTTKRFYCENGKPLFIRRKLMFNGVGDCSDWSDECPSKQSTGDNVLSSRYELIANPVLRAAVWIMAILALAGNMVVLIRTVRLLRLKDIVSRSLKINHMLVLNLAFSDILMGIYLLMLGAAGARYSGIYCSNDLAWRSGNTCLAMGILVVLSSESSVITMGLLTSFRLYTLLNPFKSMTTPKPRIVTYLILLCWLISTLIAVLPAVPRMQSTFTSTALMKDNLFFEKTTVNFSSFQNLLKRATIYSPTIHEKPPLYGSVVGQARDAYLWEQLEALLKQEAVTLPNFNVTYLFGYYSENSVCIPKIFVTTKDKVWSFSFSVTTFNFIVFLYFATAYAFIGTKSIAMQKFKNENSRSSSTGAKNQSVEIQKRIFRLVLTDFCCWVPITIMAFINFSGVKVPSVAYAVSAIVLLPINSALNPIIYSNVWELVLEKCKQLKKNPSTSTSNNIASTRL